MENLIQQFIENNIFTWQSLLTKPPYNLKIRCQDENKNPKRYLFSYDMINSDMSIPLVQQARGMIIDIWGPHFNPVCVIRAFDKFFNYGEGHAAKLDWNGPIYAYEKLDGSLIKCTWDHNGYILWTTNNGFDANTKLPGEINTLIGTPDTFQDLINEALKGFSKKELQIFFTLAQNYVFMFELISPLNRIVVQYPKTELVFLGARHKETQEEYHIRHFMSIDNFPKFRTPKIYELSSKTLEEVINIVAKLDANNEGIVLCDLHFNRVKVKGEAYLSVHRLKDNNGQLSKEHLLKAIQAETIDDIIGIFPEQADVINQLVEKYRIISTKIDDVTKTTSQMLSELDGIEEKAKKKEYAMAVKDSPFAKVFFELYKDYNKKENIKKNFLLNLDFEQLEKLCQK